MHSYRDLILDHVIKVRFVYPHWSSLSLSLSCRGFHGVTLSQSSSSFGMQSLRWWEGFVLYEIPIFVSDNLKGHLHFVLALKLSNRELVFINKWWKHPLFNFADLNNSIEVIRTILIHDNQRRHSNKKTWKWIGRFIIARVSLCANGLGWSMVGPAMKAQK